MQFKIVSLIVLSTAIIATPVPPIADEAAAALARGLLGSSEKSLLTTARGLGEVSEDVAVNAVMKKGAWYTRMNPFAAKNVQKPAADAVVTSAELTKASALAKSRRNRKFDLAIGAMVVGSAGMTGTAYAMGVQHGEKKQ